MKARGIIALAAVISLCAGCRAHQPTSTPVVLEQSKPEKPQATLSLTDIDANDERVRFTFDLHGLPHTADRIDSARLEVVAYADGKYYVSDRLLEATDIAGVDFKRYFQWEDEGVISIEIDFPPLKTSQPARLILTTTRGDVIYTFPSLITKH